MYSLYNIYTLILGSSRPYINDKPQSVCCQRNWQISANKKDTCKTIQNNQRIDILNFIYKWCLKKHLQTTDKPRSHLVVRRPHEARKGLWRPSSSLLAPHLKFTGRLLFFFGGGKYEMETKHRLGWKKRPNNCLMDRKNVRSKSRNWSLLQPISQNSLNWLSGLVR